MDHHASKDRDMYQRCTGHEIRKPNCDATTIDSLPQRKQQRHIDDGGNAEQE